MTYDDQINCRFEPISGNLNPHHIETQADAEKGADAKGKPFHERLGDNIDLKKKGHLKMATRLYEEGKYQEAMDKMKKNFNIGSLK